MKTILALDLGTRLGWAFRNSDGCIHHNVENLDRPKGAGRGVKYFNFANWLDGPGAVNMFDLVVYEDVRRHMGTDAAHMWGGYEAILTATCVREHIPLAWLGVGEIKKHATGKGNAPKNDVIAAMVARGFKPEDDNDADALALLFAYLDKEDSE